MKDWARKQSWELFFDSKEPVDIQKFKREHIEIITEGFDDEIKKIVT